MKAAVLHAQGVLTYGDIPDPQPFGDRSVLVRVGAVGVCGSDLLRFGKGTAYHYPLVLGHEFSAVVERPPAGSRFSPGDRVAVFPLLANPDDPLTEIGEPALGSGYDYFGSRRDGGMSELLYVPERNLIPVPKDMPLLYAAMVEPAAVALHAVLKLRVPANGSALVIGAGPIGALAAQWLRILGWTRVLVADVDPVKRALMGELGFETIDAAGDTVAQARLVTGTGVDAAVEASGLPITLLQALEVTAPRGQVLILGDLKGDVTIPRALISSLIRRELTVLGTWNSKITPGGRSEWDMVVSNIAGGTLQVAPLISHAVPLTEAPQTFADMIERRVWSNKVLFAVSAQALAESTDPAVVAPGGLNHSSRNGGNSMKAAVFHEPGVMVVEDLPVPTIADDEILVRVRAASICGTDLRISRHGHFKIPQGQHRVQGHEVAGDIVRIGRDVIGYTEGDRVSVTPNVGCGRCRFCRMGLNNMCPDYEAFGVSLDGGFEEYLRIPGFALQRGNVFLLPERLSYSEAALVEPLSCCLRGQEALRVGYQDTVLIVGAGPIGAFHVMLAKLAGARKIIVANSGQPRLDLMAELGADVLVNVERQDLTQTVMAETGGEGVDVAITAVSNASVQSTAVQLLATHGRLNFFAGLGVAGGVDIDTNRLHYKGLVLTGTTGSSNADYAKALRIAGDGRIDLSGMVSRSFPIEDIGQAFEYAASGAGMKAVVEFDGTGAGAAGGRP